MFGRRIGSRSSNRLRSKFVLKARGSKSRMTIPVDKQELSTLNLDEELSTLNFEEYKRLLWEKVPTEKKLGCIYFDPLWFAKYGKKKSSGSREKAMKLKSVGNIFQSRYIFIPICEANHWNLLVICNIGEKMGSELRSPCMLVLDSLHGIGPNKKEPLLRQFVFDLFKNAKKEESDEILGIPLFIPKIPQQKDGTKCGYYVLYYLYKFLLECPAHFNIAEHYPGFMNEDWFDEAELKSFYEGFFSKEESILVDERKATYMDLKSNDGNLEDSVILIDSQV